MENEQIICEERKQDLYLGRTRIPNALLVRNITNESTGEIVGLEKFIDEIIANPLPIEHRRLETARGELCELRYPEMDLSFLADMSSITEYKGQGVRLPRFGIYHIDEQNFSINMKTPYLNDAKKEGFLKSLIPMPADVLIAGTGAIMGGSAYGVAGGVCGFLFGYMGVRGIDFMMDGKEFQTSILSGNKVLPNIFGNKLIRTLEISDYVDSIKRDGLLIHDSRKIPLEVRRKFDKIGDTTFSSQVGFAVPQKTKAKIKEAEKYFERPNLYFLAEVNPEDWNATRLIEEDPLVVGLSNDKCYLVDSFNPTVLEKVVERKSCEMNYEYQPFSQN